MVGVIILGFHSSQCLNYIDLKEFEKQSVKVKSELEPQHRDTPKIRQQPVQFEPVKTRPPKTYDFSSIKNAYEFLQAWNSISPGDIDNYAQLIRNVKPTDLTKYIGSKLDDQMLTSLIRAIATIANSSSGLDSTADYLIAVAAIQRFNIVKMFMTEKIRDTVRDMSTRMDHSEFARIKTLYSI